MTLQNDIWTVKVLRSNRVPEHKEFMSFKAADNYVSELEEHYGKYIKVNQDNDINLILCTVEVLER